MALSVIGAGFGRTGTVSLKMALEKLGLGRCYHMEDVFRSHRHPERWLAALNQPPDWDAFLFGYTAALDWPSTYFWRDLVTRYPAAKVILTVRSSESWLRSMQDTVLPFMRATRPASDHPAMAAHLKMVHTVIRDRTFGGNLDDASHLISVYEQHNDEVRRAVPAERLLVYEVRQGWDPLCEFLGVPVPSVPFPRANSTEDFLSKFPVR